MLLTLVTCTRDRPEAFALTEKYIARQTRPYHQWIVLDDGAQPIKCTMGQQYIFCPNARHGVSMTNKLKIAFAPGIITGDAVVFVEDDDWLAPTWLEECEKGLQNGHIFGEGRAVYYNVKERWWYEHINLDHASLCATAIRREIFQVVLANTEHKHAFVDQYIWRAVRPERRKLIDPMKRNGQRLVVGIKAMPGTLGYSGAHSQRDKSSRNDLELEKLRSLIGADADLYEQFWTGYAPPMNLRVPPHTETGRVHGPKWAKWLSHLMGKPGIVGMEFGTWKGDSAEWMCENVFTAPDSKYFCIDPFTGNQEHANRGIDCSTLEQDSRRRLAVFPQCEVIKGFSEKVTNGWTGPLLDFCYVDGDHSAKAALRDAVLAFEIMKVGGVLVWDDYEWHDMPRPIDCPKIGVNAFLAAYADHIEVLNPRGWQIAIKKIK